jgi:hypothetical protein
MNEYTLFPLTDSWYVGAIIPGKKREQLNYLVGVYTYDKACRSGLEELQGFDLVYENNYEDGREKKLS